MSQIRQYLKLFLGIHFLEFNEVGDLLSFELFEKMPIDNRVSEFCDYIVKNYISEGRLLAVKVVKFKSAIFYYAFLDYSIEGHIRC